MTEAEVVLFSALCELQQAVRAYALGIAASEEQGWERVKAAEVLAASVVSVLARRGFTRRPLAAGHDVP